MADLSKYIESILTGLLAGGASGLSSVMAYARDIKKRLGDLEAKIGQNEEPRTGLFFSVWTVDESLKRVRREFESWEDDPPEWAKRLVSRARSNSSMSIDHLTEVETRIDNKIRTFNERVKEYENEVSVLVGRLKKIETVLDNENAPDSDKLLSRVEYERDSRVKAEELLKIRESLAQTNGLLRGVMAALGYLDPDGKKDPRGR